MEKIRTYVDIVDGQYWPRPHLAETDKLYGEPLPTWRLVGIYDTPAEAEAAAESFASKLARVLRKAGTSPAERENYAIVGVDAPVPGGWFLKASCENVAQAEQFVAQQVNWCRANNIGCEADIVAPIRQLPEGNNAAEIYNANTLALLEAKKIEEALAENDIFGESPDDDYDVVCICACGRRITVKKRWSSILNMLLNGEVTGEQVCPACQANL